jgi:hypothetical protein
MYREHIKQCLESLATSITPLLKVSTELGSTYDNVNSIIRRLQEFILLGFIDEEAVHIFLIRSLNGFPELLSDETE